MSEEFTPQASPRGGPPPRLAPHPHLRRRRRGLIRLGALVLVVVGVILVMLPGGSSGAQSLALRFASAWAHRNWAAMYADVDDQTRAQVPVTQFFDDYAAAYATATVTRVAVLPGTHSVGGSEVVPLRIETRLFGTLNERFTLPLVQSADATRILWQHSLTFPGLYAGETLRRITTAPPRGELLARDGAPLASVPAADNVIGSVGPATGAALVRLTAEGFPSNTEVGEDGLEQVFQGELAGRPGGELLAGSRVIANSQARPGRNVVTSIDPELQTDAVEDFGDADGGIVMMEPSTGELLAVAGTPLSQLQPPGSTFKLVTVTGVLRAGLATAETTYPDATYALIDGYKLHNSEDESCGGTLANAFAVSCNSVFAPLGVKLGAPRLVATAERYGFNSPSPISIAAESTIPQASDIVGDVALGSSAIGQYQDLASPLQMTRIAGTIALLGREPAPTFRTFGSRPQPTFPRVISTRLARTIRQMMLDVVRHGTGTAAQIPGVEVAGKTGTAQLTVPAGCPSGTTGASGVTGVTPASGDTGPCANPDSNPYDTDAWFVSFAPADHPEIVVGVLLDHDGQGGVSAAPVARDLIQDALALHAER